MVVAGAASASDYKCVKCPTGYKVCAPTVYDVDCIREDTTCSASDSILSGAAFWVILAGMGAAAIYYFNREP
jgi:hypothetical protein